MAFLFKSKSKHAAQQPQPQPQQQQQQPPSSLPAASRNLHTSDGTTPSSTQNGSMDRSTDGRSTTSPPPIGNANPNGSLTTMGSQLQSGPGFARRERSESEAGVCQPPGYCSH